MTKLYDALQESPQTGINLSNLNPEERQQVRQISITGTKGLSQSNTPGRTADVYYLEGDERAAAKLFVEEHREALERLDFSKKDTLQTSVPREVYDWILHELGERTLTKYERVVLEERSNGTRWIIDRTRFEQHPDRRYTVNEGKSARVDELSLADLYAELDDPLTESDLRAHRAVAGNVRYLLEYFRTAEEFACSPVTINEEMALRKH
ncbi:hypothetical protein [Salinilacihabitans rarus]|uniref:hypothetical protein n=1 Tax=Salinilacihabitans rarus TaxID=2961596 RepID=UPI0020C86AC4|nr:hypothetical protein [Salinilacihabitans rarus]